jgi:NAD(P)-dependent dehydrogenase (short-subunit alcohol dehydrogenase family)
VTVASLAEREARLDLDDLNYTRRRYDPSAAYAQSTVANLLFAFELQRRLAAAGSIVRSLAAHPGLARRNLLRAAAPTIRLRLSAIMQRVLGLPAEQAALPVLYAATMPVAGGAYIGPADSNRFVARPALVETSAAAQQQEPAAALWRLSEQLTGVHFGNADISKTPSY